MSLALKRLAGELMASMSIICPDVDSDLLEVRLEEILNNYELRRRSDEELEADMAEKIDLYLSPMKIEGLAVKTLYNYHLELDAFARHCPKATVLVTTADIRSYLSSCENIMMSTLVKKLSVLKSFFGWLVREEVLLRDPTAKVKTPKVPKRLKKSLTIEELETVRESCKTLRQRALVELMYATGCRLSEVEAMNKDDIDVQNQSMRVIGKGDKERTVFLSFKALFHVRKYLMSRTDNCESLFVTNRRPIDRLGKAAIQKEIDKIEQAAGISKPLTPHILRHTFAQLKSDAGIDLADLQNLMGHSSPNTTQTYAQVSGERKHQAYKKYHVQ